METKVKNILEAATTIPVIEEAFPDIFPCITFHFYNENGALFGAGTATEESASCQVDIWYKTKTYISGTETITVKTEINNIKQAIVNERYFSYPKMETLYDSVKQIYHTHINFELIKESEV